MTAIIDKPRKRPTTKRPKKVTAIKPVPDEDESFTYFLSTSKGVYPLSVLKAAEKKKPTSKQLKSEQAWMEEQGLIPLPFEAASLLTLKDSCSYFDSCIKQIAKDVVGQGYKIVLREGKKESPQERKRIEEFIETSSGERNETFMDTLERGLIDWGTIGWWGWEASRDDKDLVNGMWHVPAQTIRVHKSHEKYCQIRNDKKVWFKRFGLDYDIDSKDGKKIEEEKDSEAPVMGEAEKFEPANELIYYRNYYPQSDYYGAPNIFPGVGAIIGMIGARDYNLSFFENYGIPAALVILKGKWSKDTGKQIADFLDVEIKGSDNAHKSMIIHPHKDSVIEYIKLGVEVKEGSFKLYLKMLRDEVLVCYKMPPYRIGIAETGSLGGSTADVSTRIYADSVVKPLEQVIERLVTNDIFVNGLKCVNYKFELEELDLRDLEADVKRYQILFSIGMMTPNQGLESLGGKPYPEGNQYFVASNYLPIGEAEIEKSIAEKINELPPAERKAAMTHIKKILKGVKK